MAQLFHGEHGIGDCPRGDELWAEARALVGVKAAQEGPFLPPISA